MTTDMENELRDLLREKAGEAPLATPSTPAAAPQRVLRRGRLHQVGTVLGSAALVLALLVGSVAGLSALLRSDEDPLRTGETYEVFERTATIEAFTVTSPSDWYLVNEWPSSMQTAATTSEGTTDCTLLADGETEFCLQIDGSADPIPQPYGLPMFQLSNEDIGLQFIACGEDLPADMAVLYVALDYERAIEGIADPTVTPWPAQLREPGAAGGTCGAGRYTTFSVNGEPFFAWVGLGDEVTAADRSTVLTAFESMVVDDSWEPAQPDQVTPAYVIAGGVSEAGDDWRLELRPSARNVEMTLMGATPWGAQPDFAVPETPIEWCCTDEGLIEVTFGAVSKDATGVELRTIDGVVLPGVVVPLPPSLPHDFDLFFIEGTEGLLGELVTLGSEGQPTEPPVAEPRSETVELTGSLNGQDWSVRFTGSFMGGESACIEVTIDGPPGHFCPDPVHTTLGGGSPYFNGSFSPALYLLAGSVPPEVVEIRFASDDGPTVPGQFRCQMGPLGWTNPDRKVCAIALPPEGSGTLEYLDAEGTVLFEESMAWGSAQAGGAAPTPVDPVQGGAYWAVYAWLGAEGGSESSAVVGQLFDDYGIQAYQGDLACDQGAAEALGIRGEYVWRVAVYFDAEEDAQRFAKEADLLDLRWDPVAEVTTYCLD
jgi:hypothetical protein